MARRPAGGIAAAAAIVLGLGLAGCGSGHARRAGRSASPASRPASRIARPGSRVAIPRGAVRLALGAPGRAVPRGFLGLSIEFQAIRAYTGGDPHAIDPVFEALVRGLSPGQAPEIRVGGDSTDVSWVPARGVRRPWFSGYLYALTPGWLATTAAFAHDVGARMTLGLNLAAGQPALDAAEARAFLRALGRSSISALEVGNEPNLYDEIAMFTLPDGKVVKARRAGYGPPAYRAELSAAIAAVRGALGPATPAFAGPALAAGQNPLGAGAWTRQMGTLLADEPGLRTLTVHRYPLKRCFVTPGSPRYPTRAELLSPAATTGLAAGVRLWVRTAAAHGDAVRVDELNSVACRGAPGVSDTFASALWSVDALFALADAGVAGVNVHTLPDAAYEPFAFDRRAGHWRAHVLPEYYGLELFAQAAPVGSRLEAVTGAGRPASLGAWATIAPGGTRRLVLIDEDAHRSRTVVVHLPPGARGATIERMTAPGVAATGGVTLGDQGFGEWTSSGRLGAPHTTPAPLTSGGDIVVRVPSGSAALVTTGG